MKLAINYSTQAVELLQQRQIRFDLFKSIEWPSMIDAARKVAPTYVHFGLEVGRPGFAQVDLDEVARIRDDTSTPLVNLHLATREIDLPDAVRSASAPARRAWVQQRLIQDTARAVERFGAGVVMVESLYPDPDYGFVPECMEPEVIAAVVEQTGCGFLLDLSHARLAAGAYGHDERSYVQSLPLSRLRELHVTGISHARGRLRDHMPLTETDWVETEHALQRIHQGDWPTPWVCTLEYGGVGPPFAWRSEASVLAEQVPRLLELVARV